MASLSWEPVQRPDTMESRSKAMRPRVPEKEILASTLVCFHERQRGSDLPKPLHVYCV